MEEGSALKRRECCSPSPNSTGRRLMQQAQTCYEPPSAALPTRFVCPPPHRPATPPVSCMNIRHAYRGSRSRTVEIDICKSALLASFFGGGKMGGRGPPMRPPSPSLCCAHELMTTPGWGVARRFTFCSRASASFSPHLPQPRPSLHRVVAAPERIGEPLGDQRQLRWWTHGPEACEPQ